MGSPQKSAPRHEDGALRHRRPEMPRTGRPILPRSARSCREADVLRRRSSVSDGATAAGGVVAPGVVEGPRLDGAEMLDESNAVDSVVEVGDRGLGEPAPYAAKDLYRRASPRHARGPSD